MPPSPSESALSHKHQRIAAWLPWLTWGLGALLFCYAFFHRLAPSVMIDSLMRDLAVGGALLGNLSAFYFYAYASIQIPVGLTIDRWGPRRVLSISAAFCALGSIVFAGAESLTTAYLGRLMIGAGAAFAFVGSLKLATNWFPPRRFAQLTGLTMMAGMIGGIAAQAPLAALVEITGWRAALTGAAVAGGIIAAAIWIIVRDRPPTAAEQPPDAAALGGETVSVLQGLVRVLRTPQNWLIALTSAVMTAPMLSFAGLWGVAWLMQTRGFERPEAAATTSLLLIGWAVGSPITGWLSDRLGRRKPILQASMLLGLLALLAILYLPDLPVPVLWALFAGSGMCFGAMAVGFAMARTANATEVTGAAYGFVNMAVTATGAIFQPLIGWLLDLRWSGEMLDGARVYSAETYGFALASLPIFMTLGLLATLFLHSDSKAETHRK
ncbi:MAG: MFS transporter [Rhodovibrionaceae bacterium]|nr:MFS transporter [Rhodovibrionaceae bacterium]